MNSSSFLIDYQCPHCGAPAVLSETDRLFACGYCRTRSYLLDPDGFRFRFQPSDGAGNDLVYFPYWRFKGMVFACTPSGIRDRFVDLSLQGVPSRHFPVSVGLRSQALRLTHVMPDDAGRFIPPRLNRPGMLAALEVRLDPGAGRAVIHRAEIGETACLIFAPYRVRDRIIDAILDEPVSPPLTGDVLDDLSPGKPAAGVRFLSTLCPGCGWDLEGGRDAHLLICRNCDSAWTPETEGFRRMGVSRPAASDPGHDHLPFWCLQADVEGIALATYADLVRAANLPKVIQPGWDSRRFRFWAPAFKIRPSELLRLLHTVTLAQPGIEAYEPGLPHRIAATVNLPYREALETTRINLAGWLKPSRRVESLLPTIRIRPRKVGLVYLPFAERHQEYVSQGMGFAVRKSHLTLASNL